MALVTIPGLKHFHRHHSITENPGQIQVTWLVAVIFYCLVGCSFLKHAAATILKNLNKLRSKVNSILTLLCCSFQVIFGPMFSGKTTELLRRIKRYQVANHSCLLVKYAKDVRYDTDGVATHDRQTLKATPATVLCDVKKMSMNHTVIGIDEGQFFPDIVEFAEEMAGEGKTIIIAALDGTFQRKAFGNILNLVPLAESVVKLSAVCMNCYKDASFTKRLGYDKRVEVIGGADKYMSVCRECYGLAEVQDLLSNSKYPKH